MTGLRFAVLSLLAASWFLSACSQCTVTDCGGGRSAMWCTKQGKNCPECRNHKLTNEKGETLYGCEDASTTSTCDNFIKRDITDSCATGRVCTGLNGRCTADAQCCTGVCGPVTMQCITR
ncbi:MAG: hypothetical protein JNJ54_01480 [Myxococcaceae bacterium]|nr:hypothetical protein [Myxococcaceae bacterium]